MIAASNWTDNMDLVRQTNRFLERPTPFPVSSSFFRSRLYTSEVSINPLIAAGDQLFSILVALREVKQIADTDKLFSDLAHEIKAFDHQAQVFGYDNDTVVIARYLICCLLDKFVIKAKLIDGGWGGYGLTNFFYGGTTNRELSAIVSQLVGNPSKNLHIMEFIHVCLSFDLADTFAVSELKANDLIVMADRLYQVIIQQRPECVRELLIESSSPKSINSSNSVATVDFLKRHRWFLAVGISLFVIGIAFAVIGSLKLQSLQKEIFYLAKQLVTTI